MLDIQILSAATATVLRFDGELTTSAAGAVRAAAHRLRRSGGVTVDLGGVEKVDRPGLAALVALLMKARSGTRSVRLRGATPAVQDLLRREGIDRLFPIQPVALPAAGVTVPEPSGPLVTGGHDLVVVANRLPIQRADADASWETSPGGLVRALLGTLRQGGGAWVGWAGSAGDAPAPFDHEGVHLQPLALSQDEYEGFYEGFSNEALWPLYHDGIRPSTFEPEWWDAYVEVNQRFAEAAAAVANEGAVVWVHDYQLQLVPAMLRELRPDVRIGFFLHIPFPPAELFSRLPWREQVLEGLLGADVVGFQRQVAVENFASVAHRLLDVQGDLPYLKLGPRRIHVGAHPISIDVEEFDRLARVPETVEQAWKLRNRMGSPRSVLLGVDRLDYTKGIVERLRAFERLLEDGRIRARDVVMVLLAVPTRARLEHYAEERRQVEQLVGSINGQFSRIGYPAVHYLHQSLSLEELIPLYQAADVMLVTPLGDGMNLVAKEFAVSRTDGLGVLVLSEFAGAADELTDALLVNPHDQAALCDVIVTALEMPTDEVRARMAAIRATVEASDVQRWAEGFLTLLEYPEQADPDGSWPTGTGPGSAWAGTPAA